MAITFPYVFKSREVINETEEAKNETNVNSAWLPVVAFDLFLISRLAFGGYSGVSFFKSF